MNRQKPEDVLGSGPGAARPFTGAEYLESLRDGREVYIYGEQVKDVTTHPAFRNAARTIARLYDALHDPKQQAVLTCPTDTGSGSFTHKFFRVAHSREDLIHALLNAKGSGAYDAMIALAEQCMADYDDNGWTGDTWTDKDWTNKDWADPNDLGNRSGSSA